MDKKNTLYDGAEESLPRTWPKLCSFALIRCSRAQRVGRPCTFSPQRPELCLGIAQYQNLNRHFNKGRVFLIYDSEFIAVRHMPSCKLAISVHISSLPWLLRLQLLYELRFVTSPVNVTRRAEPSRDSLSQTTHCCVSSFSEFFFGPSEATENDPDMLS